MNNLIEILNHRGGDFLNFAGPMLWQSGLLISVLFAFEFLFRRKVRASIRYLLWLVVLIKLCVPPTFALPTSPAWWLHKTPVPVAAKAEPRYTVTYDSTPLPEISPTPTTAFVPPKATLTKAAGLLLAAATVSVALLCWLLVRWWQITMQIRRAPGSGRLTALAGEMQKCLGTKFRVQVKLTPNSMSPAVCGLFRPVILIPQSLAENFPDEQLRAVLLHELIHLRRRDVWLNFFQALLQIAYWWHPLVWLANAHIRRVREEAVDDAVMLALRDEAEAYAPTLLAVAKLALNRPLASLGLVGILESRHALRQRIERLVDFRAPRRAGLTLVSLLGILAFTAVAVPMGNQPAPAEKASAIAPAPVGEQSLTVKVNPEIFIRNVKAQAKNYLHATNDDYTDVLLDILRGEGVDCTPPHGLAFNTGIGEITTQNTSEQLEIFRQVIEQINRADGKCELPLRNIFHCKSVLVEARIYQMPAGGFQNMVSGLQFYPGHQGSDAWWSVSPDKFKPFVSGLESSGLQLIQRPRIKTGSGMSAFFYVGNGTNGIEFDCMPFAADGFVDLTLQSTVISGLPANTFINHFGTKASALDHGGIVVRVENYNGDAGSNLLVVISAEIVTNEPPVKAGDRGQPSLTTGTNTDVTNIPGILSDTNFRAAVHALEQKTGAETMPEPEVTTASGHGINKIAMTNISVPISKGDASHLVQDAKLDYEMGKLDEAERLLNSALLLDSENAGAKYYLGVVSTARQSPKSIQTSPGRKEILAKLSQIKLDRLGPFDDLPLPQVVQYLSEAIKPESIRITIAPSSDTSATIAPNTGLPVNKTEISPAEIKPVTIHLFPSLENVSLENALDAVISGASRPLNFSIVDDGIVFSEKSGPGTPMLFSRHFRVGTNAFVAALQKRTGLETNNVSQMAYIYISKIGVDLNVPGKAVYFNDRLGELFVRATASDLDKIEQTIIELPHSDEPQIHIKARFIEAPKGTVAGLGNFLNSTNSATGQFTGILNETGMRTVLHSLEARKDVETFAEPEVVTTSGRQIQMRATQIITVITNMAFQEGWTNLDGTIVSNSVMPQTCQIETGPVLDVVPQALSDGYTINLQLTPSLTEFLGYDTPTNTTVVYTHAGEKIDLPKILPYFTVQQMMANLNLRDNQTLLMSGMNSTSVVVTKDKVPVLGDLPLMGRLFQSQSKTTVEKEVLVFITAALVDPAGNRIHSDN